MFQLLPINPNIAGRPILLLKFIRYTYFDISYNYQTVGLGIADTSLYIRRVLGVSRDFRSIRQYNQATSTIIAKIQRAENILVFLTLNSIDLGTLKLTTKELILIEASLVFVLKLAYRPLTLVEELYLDYIFKSSIKLAADSTLPSLKTSPQRFSVRRFYADPITPSTTCILLLVVKTYPIRRELEILAYREQILISRFYQSDIQVISVPLLIFINSFGLYRNINHSLIGIYTIIGGYIYIERNRRTNIIPLTLGPYSSNFEDIIKSISSKFKGLNIGDRIISISSQDFRLCVYIIAFISDILQQNQNIRLISQNTNRGYRYYTTLYKEQNNLKANLGPISRYYYELYRQRLYIATLSTVATKDLFTIEGLSIYYDPLALLLIILYYDIVKGFLSNIAHSEFQGITKDFHLLLIKDILVPTIAVEYTKFLRSFPRPIGQGGLQSPCYSLGSYLISNHSQSSYRGYTPVGN